MPHPFFNDNVGKNREVTDLNTAGIALLTALAVKDFVFKNELDEILPATLMPDAGSKPANQALFASRMGGVSLDRSSDNSM